METLTSKTERRILLLVSGADSGGARTHVLSLARSLAETRLICLGDGPLARRAAQLGLSARVLAGSYPAQLVRLRSILLRERPLLLHCHGTRANVSGALLKNDCPGPVAATVHSDHILDYLGRPAAQCTLGALNAAALGRMDALVCVSEAMAALYRSRGFDNVYSIYNGVDFSRPGALPSFPVGGHIVIGTAARLDAVKDLATLLRGFAAAAEKEPRLLLRIAGAGRQERRLRKLADRLGIAERAIFQGWVEDTESFYASLHIVVLTSRSETFPYALLTASRYSLPVISTDVGGVSALVEDGVGGRLIPPGDAAALSRAILELTADRELRERMGRALRRRGEERFTLAAMAARQREIYTVIIQNSREYGGR